jgi:hypothetical protein
VLREFLTCGLPEHCFAQPLGPQERALLLA